MLGRVVWSIRTDVSEEHAVSVIHIIAGSSDMTIYFYQTSRRHMAEAKLYPHQHTTTKLTYFSLW
jgi:hypothetical protein